MNMKEFKIFRINRSDLSLELIGTYHYTHVESDNKYIKDAVHRACNIALWNRSWQSIDKSTIRIDNIVVRPLNGFTGEIGSNMLIETKRSMYLAKLIGWKRVKTPYRALVEFLQK